MIYCIIIITFMIHPKHYLKLWVNGTLRSSDKFDSKVNLIWGRSTNGELKMRMQASGVKRGRSLDAHHII